MPSMTCTCGHRFGTGSFPNKNAFLAISEEDYDDLGNVENVEELDRLLFASTKMYQCLKCGELIVTWKGAKEPMFYTKN